MKSPTVWSATYDQIYQSLVRPSWRTGRNIPPRCVNVELRFTGTFRALPAVTGLRHSA